MPTSKPQRKLLLILGVLFLATLACLGGSDAPPVDTVDTSATEAALQATQNALEAQQQQQQQDPPTQPPPADDPPPQDSPPAQAPDLSNLQSGDIIYATEFDGAGDWEEGWFHFPIPEEDDTYSSFVENDYLYVEVLQGGTTVYVIYEEIYLSRDQADVRLDTFVDNVGEARDNNISLVCRVTDDGWYEFSLTSSGLYFIWKFDGEYEILSQGGLQGYNRNDTDHELAVTCIDDELTFAIDGEIPRYGTVTDSSFREGSFGVSVYTERNNQVAVEFDYFIASVP